MKYYVRQIKPFIQFMRPYTGICYAVDGYGWVPEDMEEELRQTIVTDHPRAELTFKERFVEVDTNV